MKSNYFETPHNFQEIESYVTTGKAEIAKEIIATEKCYFYDACSLRKHAQLQHPEWLFSFILKHAGNVVITRCILMELASKSGLINEEYIIYIKKMYNAGIKILVVYEEDMFDVMEICFASIGTINQYLSHAVKNVKGATSTINRVFETDKGLRDDVLKGKCTDRNLFERYFHKIRENKEAGDNLGEELVTICTHLLSNIPENVSYKYVILTEDKGAIGLINKASNNVYQYQGMYAFSAMTTVRLAQRLYEDGIILKKEQVEEILLAGVSDNMLKILASEEYDLKPQVKSITCSQLAAKIVAAPAIHINY